MTCLCSQFKTKKEFLHAVRSGEMVYITDPSIFDPKSITLNAYRDKEGENYHHHQISDHGRMAELMQGTLLAICLDHPKRMKFAKVLVKADGELEAS